jgi:hypothetical protein
MASGNHIQVKALRLRLRRGLGTNTTAATIRVRCSRDGRPYSPWVRRTLGLAGQREQIVEFGGFGNAYTFQFEIASTDQAPVNLVKGEVKTEALGH